jgi:hypothetical protein
MYRSKITIPSPVKNTVGRYLFNIGYGEVYDLERDPTKPPSPMVDVMVQHVGYNILGGHSVFIPADHVIDLKSGYLSDYTININNNPPAHKPSGNPFKMNQQPQPFLRFPGQKITIVIDVIGEDDVEDGVKSLAAEMSQLSKNDIYKAAVNMDGEKHEKLMKKSEYRDVARAMKDNDY